MDDGRDGEGGRGGGMEMERSSPSHYAIVI